MSATVPVSPSLPHCVTAPGIILCTGARGITRRAVRRCPTCERRTPWVESWDGAYYGWHGYCINCLDGWWSEGCRMERPSRRHWRRERAAEIKALWDSALLPAEYERWVRLDIHRVLCHEDDCATCEVGAR